MPENDRPVCPYCMERHEPDIIRRREMNIWKGVSARYEAEYYWRGPACSYFADERLILRNHKAMIRAALAQKHLKPETRQTDFQRRKME